jgi:hypothetical protein
VLRPRLDEAEAMEQRIVDGAPQGPPTILKRMVGRGGFEPSDLTLIKRVLWR